MSIRPAEQSPDQHTPLISIVTPSYNQGQFIRETITSVLGQSYPHLELWVMDGGSSDNTVETLRSFEGDPRFRWVSERDRGQSDAINKGLACCTGEVFAWLNSDDVLLPNALTMVANTWKQLHEPAILYGLARYIDQHGQDLGSCPHQSPSLTVNAMLRMHSIPIQPATFAPTAAVRELGGVDESLHFTMDFDLWIRLAQQLPFHHIPYELAFYRLHDSSKTSALSERFISDYQKVLERSASQGMIKPSEAKAYSEIFAARVQLTPDLWRPRIALPHLFRAMICSPLIFPEAALTLVKAIIRLAFGERFWAHLRWLRTQPFPRRSREHPVR